MRQGAHVDPHLIERAQRGDQEAFARIAAEASDRLYSVALRVLRDSEAARDALQIALVHIWRDLPSLRDPLRFEAWSYRIILNCCRADRRRAHQSVILTTVSAIDAPVSDSQGAVAMRDELEQAFRGLTDQERAVLVLRYYRDLSVVEIAEAVGTSVGTVKSRLHYARRAIRAAIEANTRSREPQEGRQ